MPFLKDGVRTVDVKVWTAQGLHQGFCCESVKPNLRC